MQISVNGKQLDVGENLRNYAEDKISGTVSKFFSHPIKAVATFSKEGTRLRADVSVHPASGLVVQGVGTADDAYNALDEANTRILKQLRKYKTRLIDHKSEKSELAKVAVIEPEDGSEEVSAPGDAAPVIVAEMQAELPLCTVSGAVMRMDLADVPALMFRNIAHGGLNLVYRRADGNIGWVDPQAK